MGGDLLGLGPIVSTMPGSERLVVFVALPVVFVPGSHGYTFAYFSEARPLSDLRHGQGRKGSSWLRRLHIRSEATVC